MPHQKLYGADNSFYGKRHSVETKRRISEARSSQSQEQKDRISAAVVAANKRRQWTPEMRKNNSDKLKGRVSSEEHRRKISVASKGKPKNITPEWRANIIKALRGRKCSDEQKQRMSVAAKKRYENKEYKAKIIRHLARISRPTRPEIILYAAIAYAYPRYRIEHEYLIGKHRVDFAIRSLRIVFEADGVYWHRDKNADRKRDRLLQSQGWSVQRFGERKIMSWVGTTEI